MLLSKSGEYALQALLHLAEYGGERPLRTVEIAEALDVPRNYLSKILHQLVVAGILDSARGPRGGFQLIERPEDLTLADALRPIESNRLAPRCLMGRGTCSDADPCAAHARWQELSGHITDFLGTTTLGDLVHDRARSS
jgi:Rrf2 family iron-sulfur cluster assembly transcriptional regulator